MAHGAELMGFMAIEKLIAEWGKLHLRLRNNNTSH